MEKIKEKMKNTYSKKGEEKKMQTKKTKKKRDDNLYGRSISQLKTSSTHSFKYIRKTYFTGVRRYDQVAGTPLRDNRGGGRFKSSRNKGTEKGKREIRKERSKKDRMNAGKGGGR